jgi:hypothetical protein
VDGDGLTVVASTAKLFSQRPSSLVGIPDPVLALAFDLAAAERLLRVAKDAVSEELPVNQTCL